ncbi:MAG TPA: Trk system potassium transporter TrkA [Saprospiraceae bacterium]|nr:Trk system potassium transporter TrkA [Lewinellaceae bacterium]HPQ21465.1 Trk system potassium transporter TrkA [Saprospiraceae bacterium]
MRIVIAGAGDIGFHLAKLLSTQQQDIVLIDMNQDVLDHAHSKLDVITIKGDCSSLSVLEKAQVSRANLFLAVTTFENNNIVACILAKKLGAGQTIARVGNQEFYDEDQKITFRELGVDKIISPTILAAQEVERLVAMSQLTDNFAFEGGKLSVIGVNMDEDSPFVYKTLKEINEKFPDIESRAIAILRGEETILPRSNTRLLKNDHVYFIAKENSVSKIVNLISTRLRKIKNVMIIGGTDLGRRVATLLENKYKVTIIEKDKENCKALVEELENSLIIKGDPSNIEMLKEEGLESMDAFIALTPNSETNIITSLMAEQSGVSKTIALVDNTMYTHISQNIGVDTLINKKLIAANNIFRFVRKGQIEAITSLHGVDAEIIEFIIHKNNQLTKHVLRDLKFPKNALIAGVIRGEESLLPTGDFQLKVDDRVIVFALTESIYKLEEMFN